MDPLVTVVVLALAVTLGLMLGVAAGYLIISGILAAFARNTQPQPAAPAALAHQGSSGD